MLRCFETVILLPQHFAEVLIENMAQDVTRRLDFKKLTGILFDAVVKAPQSANEFGGGLIGLLQGNV